MRRDKINSENKTVKKQNDNKDNGCYNNDENVIDFTDMRATDMKNNKRVYIPEPRDIAFGTKCENLKTK